MPGAINNISVLMPVYNGTEYLKYSVRSIINQTFKNFELVIIDDGSTENVKEIIESFKDERIKYFRTEHKGTSAALNYGVTMCQHQWIARIDSDDLNTPERLEKQVRFIEENPEIDILSSWSAYFKDPAKILFLLKEPPEHEEIYKYLNIHNPVNQSGLIIRKEILTENQFNEALDSYEDFELMYRLRDKYRFANMPEYLVYTRLRETSRTVTGTGGNIFEMLSTAAFKNMVDSKSKGDHFYWAQATAWLNYFYGSRKAARGHFKNSFSLKNLTAYFTTFLPDKYFHKFINSRLRYRLKGLFENKSEHRKMLHKLTA